jgi:drug/metabolite transporter (DMT)-like permease
MAGGRPAAAAERRARRSRLSLLGPALALLSAAAWGAGDFLGGLITRAANVLVALLLVQGFGTLFTLVAVPVAGEPTPALGPMVWAGAGGIGGLVGLAGLYLALSRGTMGLVAPATALIAAALPAGIGLLRGDAAGPVLLVGMLVGLAAVVLISMPEQSAAPPLDPSTSPSAPRSGLGDWALIVVAGLGFASFYLGLDRAHGEGGGVWWSLLAVRVAALAVALAVTAVLVAVHRAPSLAVSGSVLPMALLAALGDSGGNLLYILARAETSLSIAVVLVSLYPVSTAILARLVLHERLSRLRLAGVALAVLAVALISLGATGA